MGRTGGRPVPVAELGLEVEDGVSDVVGSDCVDEVLMLVLVLVLVLILELVLVLVLVLELVLVGEGAALVVGVDAETVAWTPVTT